MHTRSLIASLITVGIGLAVAAAASDGAEESGGLPVFVWITLWAFAVNWLVFIPSFIRQTEHYYDLTGSLTYISSTVLALLLVSERDTRTWIVAALIIVWSGRLGTFLFARVKSAGKDGRFDAVKPVWSRFLMFWTIQGLWVVFTAGAAYAAMTSGDKQSLGVVGIIGLLVWAIGFGIEVVADRQKSAWRSDPANEGAFIDVGLWSWSRHPNYVGEITLWTGMALLALPALQGWQYVTLLSPVFVYVLLTRISGLPALERRADKKWGGQADYEAYKQRVPVLFPRLGR